MKNFGFNELAVVTPHPPVWDEVVSAVNAEDLLTNARVVGTLVEAIADCTLVVGTAESTRIEQKQRVYKPDDLSRELRDTDHRLALVFGQEKHGLTNDDLSHCHRVMSIPTVSDCPSMNLGQAVAVSCYELTRGETEQSITPRPVEAATAGAVETSLQLSLDVLRLLDFIMPGHEADLTRRLRSSLLRYNLSEYDVGMFCSILRRIKNGLSKATR